MTETINQLNPKPRVKSGRCLSYQEAVEIVMSLVDFERSTHSPEHSRFHIERMLLLAEKTGNPHQRSATVHVAGTKGKGSTAALITSILATQGYKVGLYTSPHLHSLVERIRVGLEPITVDDFANLVEQVWPAVKIVSQDGGYGDVTTFEMLTAMAFQHFDNISVDIKVIETGLGGRLDSTNIVNPEISVITSISLDHTKTLGDTLELIASEKAGIIKKDVPVVLAPQPREALSVLKKVAITKRAKIIETAPENIFRSRFTLSGQSASVRGLRHTYDIDLPLLGDHQLENVSTAITSVEMLSNRGFACTKQSVIRGVRNVKWPGRFEVLSVDSPTIIVDGAHNDYSMKKLVQSVKQYFGCGRILIVFGALDGHSIQGMVMELATIKPEVIVVRSRHPKSIPSDVAADIVTQAGLNVIFKTDDVSEGIRHALCTSNKRGLILATGSLSVVAEVIEVVQDVPREIYPNIKRAFRKDY